MAKRTLATVVVAAIVLVATTPAGAEDFGFEFGGPDRPDPERLALAASSVAIDADGNPWVADPANDRIVKYGYDGTFVAAFGDVGGVPVSAPRGLAADAQGTIYVALGTPQVLRLDVSGRPLPPLELRDATGVGVSVAKLDVDAATGRLFATDGTPRVEIFERDGRRIGSISVFGSAVRDVTVDGGRVAIVHDTADPAVDGVDIFTVDRRYITQFTMTAGVRLEEAAFDPLGRLVIADPVSKNFLRVDLVTFATEKFGKPGLGVGEMNGPVGIDVDCRGNIYVLDDAARSATEPIGGSKVLKYTVPSDPPPCAPRPAPDDASGTQVNDVEVMQAVQPFLTYTADAGARARSYGQTNGGAPSGEVGLKAGHATVVRVYANLAAGPAGGLSNIPATLEGFAGGRRLGVLQPVGRPSLLRVGSRVVDALVRSEPAAAYSFELPAEWTQAGTIALVARVNTAGVGGCDARCAEHSTFRLDGVTFGRAKLVRVAPIALTVGGRRPYDDPSRAFEIARRVLPVTLEVWGWQADVEVADLLATSEIRVEDCFLGIFPCSEDTYGRDAPEFRKYLQGELMDRIEDVADDRDIRGCDRVAIGLAPDNENLPGVMRGELEAAGLLPCALGYAVVSRPLTAVAHELQHALGRPHAGQGCPQTGKGEDQEGEPWPPDDRGLLGGIGLDTKRRSLNPRGPFSVLAAGVAPNPSELFDMMSYCAGSDESAAWVSPRNWAQLSTWRLTTSVDHVPATLRAASVRRLRVAAVQFSSGKLAITGVSPTSAAGDQVDPASPYVLEAMDANGTVLASAPAAGVALPDVGGVSIGGTVDAPTGTAQVFLRRGREAGTRRVGSPRAPTVRLLAPAAGQTVAGPALLVTWRAADADGDQLAARVEFSANGGRTWTTLQAGPSRGRVAVPRALLTGSRAARVRVRIDDGFHEAVALSPPFAVIAPPPLVSISSPTDRLKIAADAPLTVSGAAVGAGGRPLPGARLTWFDGPVRLGTGRTMTLTALAPGRHVLRLVARQGAATGSATRVVTVRGVAPLFLLHRAPASIPRSATSVKIRVASTVAATLIAGGTRSAVGPAATTVKVAVRPGSGRLVLKLILRAGRRSTTVLLTIARR